MNIPLGTPNWQRHMHRYARQLLDARMPDEIRIIVAEHRRICGDVQGDNLSAFLNYQRDEIRAGNPLMAMPDCEVKRLRSLEENEAALYLSKADKHEQTKARFAEGRAQMEVLAS